MKYLFNAIRWGFIQVGRAVIPIYNFLCLGFHWLEVFVIVIVWLVGSLVWDLKVPNVCDVNDPAYKDKLKMFNAIDSYIINFGPGSGTSRNDQEKRELNGVTFLVVISIVSVMVYAFKNF